MIARFSRRSLMGGAAAFSAGLWQIRPGHAASPMGFDDARHLLSRTSFGATPSEIRDFEVLDHAGAVDRLLGTFRSQAATPAPDWLDQGPAEVRGQQKIAKAEVRRRAAEAERGNVVDRKTMQPVPLKEHRRELLGWWIEEMLVTDQPLVERMVLFWHNHFTSSWRKLRYAPALFRQNALFRREALGNFAALLMEVACDPAMLMFLDGVGSVAGQPNENFARELLELFTLGEGHYSDADVKAAARAFTGWTVSRETGQFAIRTQQHDDGEKTFLGQTGRFGGEQIIAILLKQPRTAETIVEKLWREFVSPQPDTAEVKRLAASFRASGYEIRPLLRALLLSQPFRDSANRAALIKSPVDLIIGTVRLLGLPVHDKREFFHMFEGLGQVPFDPPNVKGWPGGESWITTYTLLLRQQFLRRIVEATTVVSMDGGMLMGQGLSRRVGRRQKAPPDDAKMQLMEPAQPMDGRSLRNTLEARLGPTLAGIDSPTLLRTLLPRPPIEAVDASGAPGVVVAAALLDAAYQLK